MQYSLGRSPGPFSSVKCPCRRTRQLQVCRVFWSRTPDSWDAQWEAEEQLRRQQAQQVEADRQSAEEAAWRQQVDIVHQQLLDQQKHRAALRSRLQQDAQRAKQDQLRRIAPVAKARARARGLASLGLDPQILSLSEKFGKMSDLVDEVQQQVEAQYGLMQQHDGSYGPSSAGAAGGSVLGGLQHGGVQQSGQMQQAVPQQRQQQTLQQLLRPPAQLNGPQAQAIGPAANQRSPTQQVYQQRRAAAPAGSVDVVPARPAASSASTTRLQQQWQQQAQQLPQQPTAVPTQHPLSPQLSDAAAAHRHVQQGGVAQHKLHGSLQASGSASSSSCPRDGTQWQLGGQLQQVRQQTPVWPEEVPPWLQQQANRLQQPAMTQEATRPVQPQQQTRRQQQRQPMVMPPNAVQQSVVASTQQQVHW